MRGELTLKFNGQEVRVFQEANMWLFDTQEGVACKTYQTSRHTLEDAIRNYEFDVEEEKIEKSVAFIKRQLNK